MQKRTAVFLSVVVSVFILLGVVNSKGGLRGSDQYWYVADTESLLEGRGVQTNYITPINVVDDSTVQNKGFVHNVPQIYIALIPGLLLGAFDGWLFMNALFSILAALLLFLTVKRFVSADLSALVALVLLVIPLAFWHAYQPLAEAFHAFLLSGILYVYYSNGKRSRYYWMGILSLLLLLCRNNYILVALAVTLLFYLESGEKFKLVHALLFLASICLLFVAIKRFFPDTYNYSYAYVSVTGNVGQLDSSTSLDLASIYARRAGKFFATQFLAFDSTSIFYHPFNLFAVGTVVLWLVNRKRKLDAPILLAIFSLAFLFLTAVIAWYQARYLLPFYPLVIFAFFVEAKKLLGNGFAYRLLPGITVALILISLAADSFLTYRTYREGRTEQAIRQHYSAEYDSTMSPLESLIYANQGWDQITTYTLRPRLVFLGNEEVYLRTNRYRKLVENQQIAWLLTPKELGLRTVLPEYDLLLEKRIPPFESEPMRYLYRIVITDGGSGIEVSER